MFGIMNVSLSQMWKNGNGDEKMEDYKRVGKEKDEYIDDTQKLIIEMVKKIDNEELLVKIYTFIKTWLE